MVDKDRAHYEVWGVSDIVFVGFMSSLVVGQQQVPRLDRQQLMEAAQNQTILRREIPVEDVVMVDEVWRVDEALREIVSRFNELDGPVGTPAQPQQPSGNGAQAATT